MKREPATTVELRFAVDTGAPLVYVDTPYPEPPEDLAVEVGGPGVLAILVVAISEARAWASELNHAVSVAYREATGDPHTLSDTELATLPAAGGYEPGPGVVVVADEGAAARVRFHVVVDIAGATPVHLIASCRHRGGPEQPAKCRRRRRILRRATRRQSGLSSPVNAGQPILQPSRIPASGWHT